MSSRAIDRPLFIRAGAANSLHVLCVYKYVRGRVSKYVTNGSKTALMDVIGFLCVSIGSSKVQHHDSVGCARACREAGFSSQNGDRA
jgi:hypothetical protein